MAMNDNFSRVLALLRQEKGISQRKAAGELGISQALLSHYENGAREPGLEFVVKACDFYNVSHNQVPVSSFLFLALPFPQCIGI